MRSYEELLDENAALRARVAELEAENAALKARVAELLARLTELESRVKQNSRNSFRPPSSDPPNVAARPKRKPSGRRRGGQPGHKGTTRSLLPPEKVDRTIDLRPGKCRSCAAELRGNDPKPRRLQQIDVPPVVVLWRCRDYFEKHRERIRYDEFRRHGS